MPIFYDNYKWSITFKIVITIIKLQHTHNFFLNLYINFTISPKNWNLKADAGVPHFSWPSEFPDLRLAGAQWCLVYLRGSPGGGVGISFAGGDSRSGVRSSGSMCTLVVCLRAVRLSPCANQLLSRSLFRYLHCWPHRNIAFSVAIGIKAPYANDWAHEQQGFFFSAV